MRRQRTRLPVHEPGSEGRLDYAEGGYSQAPVTGGGGGTSITHLSPTITLSASTGTIDLGNVFTIERASCTDSGRFRLYRDTTTRNADMSRIVLTEPTPGNGLLLEVVFAVGVMDIPLAPLAPGAPMVSGEPCAWYWEGATTSGTLTLTITQLEA